MISVCIATKNGSRYLCEQLRSILSQLSDHDEVIISDDASTDNTLEVIKSMRDSRIKVFVREHSVGIVANFEASLRQSKGEKIFLADQDDVWLPGKVSRMSALLNEYDLVASDCQLADHSLNTLRKTELQNFKPKKGLVRNLIRNSYMGCCMAFRRNVLERALPFPKDIPMHDIWIGLVSELYFENMVIPDKLVLHRIHQHNATTTGLASQLTIRKQFSNRYKILKNLMLHKTYAE